MARKKPTAKPLFAVKHDFVESLDVFINEVMLLQQQVEVAAELGHISSPSLPKILERLEALKKAMLTED